VDAMSWVMHSVKNQVAVLYNSIIADHRTSALQPEERQTEDINYTNTLTPSIRPSSFVGR